MRTAAAIAFLSLYLLVYTEVHEVLLLPVLMGHFDEHRAENKELSFADFLFNHYFGSHGAKEDSESHQALPFGDNHAKLASLNVTVVLTSINVHPPLPFRLNVSTAYENPFTDRLSGSSIWQPPRLPIAA